MRVEKKLYLALNKIAAGFAYIDSRPVRCGSEHAFRIPMGKAVHDVQGRVDAIVAAVGAPVELIDRGGAVIVRVVERDFPQRMPFNEADLLPDRLLIGYDRLFRPVYHRPMHLLAGGASRAGKTVWLRWILYQLARARAIVKIADLKAYSFFPFETLPGFQIAKSLEQTADMLHEANVELERRENIVVRSRNRDALKRLPYYVVVIDEAAQIAPKMYSSKPLNALAKFCDESVSRISQKGGESRVILIYCTQRPSADIVNGQVKSNVEAAVAFRTYTNYDSRIILNTEGAEKISVTTPGRCIFRGASFHTLQVPFIGESDAEWDALLQPLKVEVLDRGNSHRTESPRTYIDGVVTSTYSDDAPARNAERFARSMQESIRHSTGFGARAIGTGALPWQGKGLAAETFTDEVPD